MAGGDFSIACIGLGQRLAHVLLHLIRVDARIRPVAYVDPRPAGLARLERHGLTLQRYDDVEHMLARLRPDAVMIGSPNHLHLAHLQLALETDARIFCEKPLVRTEAESFELAKRLGGESGDRVQVGLVLRSLPVVRAAFDHVRSGRLGTVVSLEANEHLHPEHGGYLRRDWRRHSRYSGSFLLDKCCHDLDLLNAVAGSQPRRIASFAANRIFTLDHATLDDGGRYRLWPTGWEGRGDVFGSDADTADVQSLLLEYENGVIATFHCNSHVLPPRRTWFVAGTEAAMDVDLRSGRLSLHPAWDGAGGSEHHGGGDSRDHSGADPAMARDLAATWLDGARYPVSARDALVAGLVVMAADRSAHSGTTVDLGETWKRLATLLPA